jgi:hypothetical protein
MKGFSMPSISIPSVSIPKISIPKDAKSIDTGSIESAVKSAIPDISGITDSLNIESVASGLLSENVSESISGLDIPSKLNDLISK